MRSQRGRWERAKESKYRKDGIKVLSVLFIDRVANYRDYDAAGNPQPGKFAVWFEEIFEKYRVKDSSETRPTQDDNEAYALIMRDKERLLDPDEPLRFIFSHSALREGWDNPNVFQICTLNETASTLKKRQEIGRGLRLAVDKEGRRVIDRQINRLTIIANESYEEFAAALQTEME